MVGSRQGSVSGFSEEKPKRNFERRKRRKGNELHHPGDVFLWETGDGDFSTRMKILSAVKKCSKDNIDKIGLGLCKELS